MPVIRCRTLGPVEVEVDGGPAPRELVRWKKNLALLIHLACAPKRTRARGELTELLWGDRPARDARHSLSEAVRTLRRTLGDGLRADRDRLHLSADVVRLDLEEFERLAAAGRWIDAAALIGGEFLEGFEIAGASAFEDWLAVERARWRTRSAHALAAAAEQHLATGRSDLAIDCARRALRLEPESARAAAVLADAEAIAGAIAGAASGGSDAPERLRRAPLVGRAAELGGLADLWNACAHTREPALAVVDGDPGTGKSRLLEELRARVRVAGGATAGVRAVAADAAAPCATLEALLRGELGRLPGLAGADPAALAALVAVQPSSARRYAGAAGVPPADLPTAVRELLRAAADEKPVLVVIDDARFADGASLAMVGAAVRDLGGSPVLFALAAELHPDHPELDLLRSRAGHDVPGIVVRLGPLPDSALAELVAWAFPHYTPEARSRLARRIAHDSGGLPLFAVELLQAIALGLEPGPSGEAGPAPERTLDHSLPAPVPSAVVAAVRINFRRLSPDAQAVLAACSVLEERCAAERLARGAGLPPARTRAALDELEWQRWLESEPRGYAFVARVVREIVARDFVTPGRRRRILDAARDPPTRPGR